MALGMITAKQQIAIKQEGQAGTLTALAFGNVVMHTGQVEWTPEVHVIDREALNASLSPRGSIPASRMAKISFKMYLRGTSTAPVAVSNEPDFSVPFKGCGADITVSGGSPNEQSSFKPSTSLVSDETTGASCTVALYQDGKIYKIHGAMGNCVITCTLGEPAVAAFEFTGVYNAPIDGALLVPTYPTVIAPRVCGAATVVDTYNNPCFKTFTLDFGNTIAMRPFPNHVSGFLGAQIISRKPRGSFDPEEVLAATQNWHNLFLSGTVASMSIAWAIVPVNYNNFILTIPAAAYIGAGHADRDGIVTTPMEYECRANSDAGNDEWELVQT